jgi:hypothetical protein
VIDKAAAYSESKHLALAADGDPDLVEADILRTLDKIKGVVEEAGA